MDGRDNNFGIDFAPIGQAIKKARIAQNMTREQLAGIRTVHLTADTSRRFVVLAIF